MSKLLEKSLDELCANTVETVDRIMGRYNVGLEEAWFRCRNYCH